QVQYLQSTLNIQYELGIALLGTQQGDPRTLNWLGLTPALAGCLGLWNEDRLRGVGECRFQAGAPGAEMPVTRFPRAALFDLADGAAGDIVFSVPVRSRARDWGVFAAVGRIQ